MKNPALNNAILKILVRVDCGLKEKTLMDRHDLTTDEFHDALIFLEDKALVDKWDNLIGDIINRRGQSPTSPTKFRIEFSLTGTVPPNTRSGSWQNWSLAPFTLS